MIYIRVKSPFEHIKSGWEDEILGYLIARCLLDIMQSNITLASLAFQYFIISTTSLPYNFTQRHKHREKILKLLDSESVR